MKTKINKEFHKNGKLAYIETIQILSKEEEHLFNNATRHPDGFEWIRIGKQAKYYDNGQLAWILNYDNNGVVIKEKNRSYRKDGTIIVY